MSLRDAPLKDDEGAEDTGAVAVLAAAKGGRRAGSGIQIPPPLN